MSRDPQVAILVGLCLVINLLAASDEAVIGPIRMGEVTHPLADELSGLATSLLDNDLYWAINDGGSLPIIFGLTETGSYKCMLYILGGVFNIDWEDIASFEYEGRPYLVIADIGDNLARRSEVTLRIVREPPWPPDRPGNKWLYVYPAWSITFRYPDGPRDAESIAVDVENEQFLIMSKRDSPPALYTLPIRPDNEGVQVAEPAGMLLAVKNPLRRQFTFFPNLPTGMDISPSRRRAVVLTYQGLYLFDRALGEDWPSVLAKEVKPLDLPPLFQPEAVCFSLDGRHILITSERLPAPVYRWTLPKAEPEP